MYMELMRWMNAAPSGPFTENLVFEEEGIAIYVMDW